MTDDTSTPAQVSSKEVSQASVAQRQEWRARSFVQSSSPDEWLSAFLDKLLPKCLRLAVSEFEESRDNKNVWYRVWCSQEDAYWSAPRDAIRTGLIVGEEEQWFDDADSGKPYLPRHRKPDGTEEVLKIGIPASESDLQKAEARYRKARSSIVIMVREVDMFYPDLIKPDSALACVRDDESRCVKDSPEWMMKLKGRFQAEGRRVIYLCEGGHSDPMPESPTSVRTALGRIHEEKGQCSAGLVYVLSEGGDSYEVFTQLASGDLALRMYWPVVKPKLIELAAVIERLERANGAGIPDETEQAGDAGGGSAAMTQQPQQAHLRAAESYEWVCAERPDLTPAPPAKYSRKQWQYIRDNNCPAYADDDENAQPVPAFETWKRQVRAGQRDDSTPKAIPRAGREHGRSIVPHDQI